MATNIKANTKASLSNKEIKNYGLLALGAAAWIFVPSIVNSVTKNKTTGEVPLAGWAGYLTAFATTFVAGTVFNVPMLRYSGIAIGAAQLMYAKGSGMADDAGISFWRMGGNLNTQPALSGLAFTEISSPDAMGYQSRPASELSEYVSGNIPVNSGMGEYIAGQISDGSMMGEYVSGQISDVNLGNWSRPNGKDKQKRRWSLVTAN